MEEMFPPSHKRGPGRPKKLRRKEPDEYPNKVRTRTNYCCTRYGVHGHNARSCTSQVVDPEAQKRKRKPKKTTIGQGQEQPREQTQFATQEQTQSEAQTTTQEQTQPT
ncbi:unnamed protein product [Lathyrus oleraceus]